MVRWILALAIVAPPFVGCGKGQSVDNFTYVAEDDPKMAAAIEKARSTVDTFIAALKSPKAGQSAFSIKKEFADGDGREHMWLTPVTYDGQNFHGTINNIPELVKSVEIGQAVTVAPSEISDWMYIDNGKLVGGETMRALRNAATPAERAEFDKSVPFVIE
jgi:uncharacterized protein YegJ (DUF2314 family)